MRIATSQIYGRPTSMMTKLTAEADKLQSQIATGKRINAPSDDAAGFLRLQSMRQQSANDAAYASNITLAQGMLAQTDSTLDGIDSQLQRALELMTQAANGTYSDTNRAAMAKELDTIRDTLFALANTTDVRGQPLFGGATGSVAYTRDETTGAISYASSGEQAGIPIGDGVTVQGTVTGKKAFAVGDSDMFAVLAGFTAAIEAGTSIQEAAGNALEGTKQALDSVTLARASAGARAARLDLEADRLTDTGEAREDARVALEDTNTAFAVTQLQKTLTILQATQASFSKLTSLSLFDYLR